MSDVAKPAAKKYDSFAEFYPFYLSEHSDRTCRRLHFAGSTLALLCVLALIVTRNPWWLLAALLVRLRLCLDRPLRVREEPAGLVQAAALQFHGRLEDVLADCHGKDRVLSARADRRVARDRAAGSPSHLKGGGSGGGGQCGKRSPNRFANANRPPPFRGRYRRGSEYDDGRPHEPLPRSLRALDARPGRLLGRGRAGDRLVRAGDQNLRQRRRRLRPLVHRRRPATPATTRSTATWSAAARSRPAIIYDSPVTQTKRVITYAELLHEVADPCRDAAGLRRRKGRPRHPLHADGAGSAVRHVCLRAHRRDPFGRVRRLRREGACDADRRLQAEADPLGLLRHRGRARRPLQAAARCRDRSRAGEARGLPDPAAPAMRGGAHAGPRPRLGVAARAGDRGEQVGALRAGARDRPALHPLHLGHDRHPERRGARQWRPHGRAALDA